MPDNKKGRDKQARDAENRQRQRATLEELERWDETEPEVDEAELDDVAAGLATLEFPATGAEVVGAVGDHAVESDEGTYSVDDLIPATDEETFDSPATVRMRIERPTVAAAMTLIVEASHGRQNVELSGSQREAYEKTLRALKAIDADDDDEGIEEITDWIIERIREKGTLPGSRDVRRQAAKFCRQNGYEVRNDEWLGV